jgi:hypothetical protein
MGWGDYSDWDVHDERNHGGEEDRNTFHPGCVRIELTFRWGLKRNTRNDILATVTIILTTIVTSGAQIAASQRIHISNIIPQNPSSLNIRQASLSFFGGLNVWKAASPINDFITKNT